VLLNNGTYFTSQTSGKEGTWTDQGMMADPWGANVNQRDWAWQTPNNLATDGSNNYGVSKPAGVAPGEGQKYAYNSGEDPPTGAFSTAAENYLVQVVYDTTNSRFVKLTHATHIGRTYARFSTEGQGSWSAETQIAQGEHALYHSTIDHDVYVGIYQASSSGDSQGDTIVVNKNGSSDWPNADHSNATIPFGKNSLISRAVYANSTWVCGNKFGLLKSTDDADEWSQIELNYNGTACRIQHIDYDTSTGTWIAVGTVGTDFDGDSSGVAIAFRSTDNLVTWTPVKVGGIADGGFGCITTSNNGIWLMGGQNREVYRSINDGVTWTGPITTIYHDNTSSLRNLSVIAILYEANKNS
jgi:hypothetical protein